MKWYDPILQAFGLQRIDAHPIKRFEIRRSLYDPQNDYVKVELRDGQRFIGHGVEYQRVAS